MKRILFVGLLVALLSVVGFGGDFAVNVMSDASQIDLGVGYKHGLTEYGAWIGWHEEIPDSINGGGLYATFDVIPSVPIPIRQLLPGIGTWLSLPETADGTLKIGVIGGVVNAPIRIDVMVAPLIEMQVSPITAQFRYELVEGNGLSAGPVGSNLVFLLGIKILEF